MVTQERIETSLDNINHTSQCYHIFQVHTKLPQNRLFHWDPTEVDRALT